MKQVCFGVDIGGTSVKLGLVDEEGPLLHKSEFPSPRDPAAMFDRIAQEIQQVKAQFDDCAFVGAGVGVPGPVFNQEQVKGCVNLGWGDINVATELSSRTGLVVKVENDANLAALGELWHGAGKGRKSLAMLTVGTGIGCGIISNGKIISGANGAGGEAGHMPMSFHQDWQCSCGKYGCLEVTASATGIIRAAREFQPFKDMEKATAKDVFDAAKEGNQQAMEVIQTAAKALGVASAMIGCIVNPEIFIIGGGVSAAGSILMDPVVDAYRENVFSPARQATFALAQLGNNAGIYGGAGLFFYHA